MRTNVKTSLLNCSSFFHSGTPLRSTGSLRTSRYQRPRCAIATAAGEAYLAYEAGAFPGAERLTFSAPQMGPPGGAIEFKILGDSSQFHELETFAEEVKAKLA